MDSLIRDIKKIDFTKFSDPNFMQDKKDSMIDTSKYVVNHSIKQGHDKYFGSSSDNQKVSLERQRR